jgi:hypothetical protein
MGSLNAGNDVLCFAENIPEGIQYLKTHLKRIEASYNR